MVGAGQFIILYVSNIRKEMIRDGIGLCVVCGMLYIKSYLEMGKYL